MKHYYFSPATKVVAWVENCFLCVSEVIGAIDPSGLDPWSGGRAPRQVVTD